MNSLPFMLVTLVVALAVLMGSLALINWCLDKVPFGIHSRYKSVAQSGISLVVAFESVSTLLTYL